MSKEITVEEPNGDNHLYGASTPGFVLGGGALATADRAAAFAVLDAFFELGGRFVDTARDYGASEELLAKWINAHGVAASLHVITKGGHPDVSWRPRLGRGEILRDAARSVSTLGGVTINCFLLHRDDQSRSTVEIAATLSALIRSGLCRSIGVSNWTFPRVAELADSLQAIGGPRLAVVSNYFGLATASGDQPFPGVVSTTPAHLQGARTLGYRLLAWGSLSAGFFDGATGGLARGFAGPENERRRHAIQKLSTRHGIPPMRLVARWLATADPYILPVVGTLKPTHLEEILQAACDSTLDVAIRELESLICQPLGQPDALMLGTHSRW